MSIIKFDNFDPLKNLGAPKSGGGFNATGFAVQLAKQIIRAGQNRKMQKRMEEQREQYEKEVEEAVRNPPPIHGSARWATEDDLRKAGYLKPVTAFDTPSSIFLGLLRHPQTQQVLGQLHWDKVGHLITVAATQKGKSSTLVVPNLLRYRGSCVVLDPKGELYRDTAAWRRTLGPVYNIAPFREGTDSFDPLAPIKTISDARAMAGVLIPEDPKAQSFFRDDAIAFLAAVILSVAESAPKNHRTMQEIRSITAGDGMLKYALELVATGRPELANPAKIVLGKRPESLSTLMQTLNTHLSIFDEASLSANTGNTVDFRTLKDQTTTVYINVPFGKMSTYSPYLRLVLSTALDAMLLNEKKPDIPVLFLLDEFLSLKHFPEFRDAIRTHTSAGVRLWFFLQNQATLEEYYPNSWKAFFDATVKVFFGTEDTHTGRLVSDLLGNTTVAHLQASYSQNTSTPSGGMTEQGGNTGQSLNTNLAYSQRPLLTPTEVEALLNEDFPDHSRNAILKIGGAPYPIQAKLEPWFNGPICKSRVNFKAPEQISKER
ncbi:type IV secretion system protein VirD4 [Ensifer adhaerens]|nr:type IV secretion system protein VirD4 [Ensifer adhaerens]